MKTQDHITCSDISAIKELMSPIVLLMEKKDEQISELILMQKETIAILKSKDEQINRLIGLVEKHSKTA